MRASRWQVRRRSWLALAAALAGLLAGNACRAENYPVGDRATWLEPAYLAGSLRHIDEIYPTRAVPRQGAVSELLPGDPVVELGYEVQGRLFSLDDYLDLSRVAGLIVLKRGRVVYETYGLGADATSRFMTNSVAKSVVSTLVGCALADGLIGSVEDPISDYLPELRGSGYEGVPIKAVLQMSSGVSFTEDYLAEASDFNRLWRDSVQTNRVPIRHFVTGVARRFQPFERFHYAAADTLALAWLVERVAGRSLSDYLAARLWGPLGMEADASWVLDGVSPDATEVAFCCLSARLRDFARLGLLLARQGRWEGQQILPPDWVAEATRPDLPQLQPGRVEPGSPVGYQYQWWTFAGADGAFTARGVNGQFLYVNPAQDLVVVVASVWPVWWDSTLEAHSFALFQAFERRLRD